MINLSCHNIKCNGTDWLCKSCRKLYPASAAAIDERNRQRKQEARNKKGGWGPRTVGSIDGNDVTFRQGTGYNDGHTLIADGQPSGREFDRKQQHNHYGPKREGGGRVEDSGGDRGKYSGPGR